MSLGLLIGTIGALAGVALGSWLSARAQRSLFLETRRQAIRQVQLEACMAFLEAYRKLRSFVLDEAEHVELVRRTDDHGGHPKVQESSQ